MPLLELLPSHVSTRALAQPCLAWSSSRPIPKSQRRIVFSQSCHSWIYCPVMSLLEPLPRYVTLVSLAKLCHSWISCPVVSLLGPFPANFYVPVAYCIRISAVGVKKKKCFKRNAKKCIIKYHILYITSYVICVLFIMIFSLCFLLLYLSMYPSMCIVVQCLQK